MTVSDTIHAALRALGVLAAGEVASAGDAADGLSVLNQMLRGWKARGVDVGLTADLALTDTVPLAPEFVEAAILLLALRLAADYGADLSPALVLAAGTAWQSMQMAYVPPRGLTVEMAIQRLPGARRGTGAP